MTGWNIILPDLTFCETVDWNLHRIFWMVEWGEVTFQKATTKLWVKDNVYHLIAVDISCAVGDSLFCIQLSLEPDDLCVSFSFTPTPTPTPSPIPTLSFICILILSFIFIFIILTVASFFSQTGPRVAATSLPQTRLFLATVVIQVLLDWTVDWAWHRAMDRSSTVGRWPTWTSLAATVRPLHCSVTDWRPCSTRTCSESSTGNSRAKWVPRGRLVGMVWTSHGARGAWTSCCGGQEKS